MSKTGMKMHHQSMESWRITLLDMGDDTINGYCLKRAPPKLNITKKHKKKTINNRYKTYALINVLFTKNSLFVC